VTTRLSLVTLGCARNDVDSEELAARFEAAGIELVAEPSDADAVVVNTCGFVESAKKDSIDTLLAAADLKGDHRPQAVIAVGCLAERYGDQLAASLPEADAVLGFDSYPEIAAAVQAVLAGDRPAPPTPQDRRLLLPLAPADRAASPVYPPGHGDAPDTTEPVGPAPASGPRVVRRRLEGGPMAPLKLASGCDRRCSFCAIPRFRGAFVSRPPQDLVAEARWLADHGVSELFLVSENSTSYGKDLGDIRLLEKLLPTLCEVEGIERVRVSYLQPAEMRTDLISVMSDTPGVAPYFDLSFQHASGPLLRRMRRFGDTDRFLELIASIRERVPTAGLRSNFIVGFPGETEADCAELERFLVEARLDFVGVFGYSDEDGTEAATFSDQHSSQTVAARLDQFSRLVEQLTAQRAEQRVGESVRVVVEESDRASVVGRAAHQGPEVDGSVRLSPATGDAVALQIGDWAEAVVVGSAGVDLVATHS
jgi:ribosomal protein S12 methylthiotransferase